MLLWSFHPAAMVRAVCALWLRPLAAVGLVCSSDDLRRKVGNNVLLVVLSW